MNSLRTLSTLGLLAAALAANAQSYVDNFSTVQAGPTLTAPGSDASGSTLVNGVNRILVLVQNLGSVGASSFNVAGTALLANAATATSTATLQYRPVGTINLSGTTALRLDFASNSAVGGIAAFFDDASGNTQSFSGSIPTSTSPFSVVLSGTGNADLSQISSFTVFLGGGTGENFSLARLSTVSANPTPEPSALAALGLGAVALLKRRKRA